ncbi:hemicentin-1-like [Epargyreus clarus]|uniref:hemicentin-1-like n=1 Tax=Epargyreus clarus TaxID=520877 RepID=UPI003C2C8E4A
MNVQYCAYVIFIGLALTFAEKSLVIVTDTTASMTDEITILKNHIGSVVNSLRNSADTWNYIHVPFADPDVGVPIISSSPEDLINSLSDVEVVGGHDCPENSLAAIEKAFEVSYNSSNIYVFTDAPAKDHNKLRSIQILCQQRKSQVTTFLSGECTDQPGNNVVYYEIAKSCSGSVFRLDIIEFRQVFKYMKEMVNVDWSNIQTHREFTGSKQFHFKVDEYTRDIVITVSGDFPEVKLTNGFGRSPEVERIMDTRHALVIRLIRPGLEQYTADIRSRGSTLVTFYKRREVNFHYGFSTKRPRTLKETSSRPLPDSTSYILIEMSDSAIELFSLELRINGRKTILDLELVDEEKGLYTVQFSFEAYKQFRICVHGREKNTFEVINGASTMIAPQQIASTSPSNAKVEMIELESTLVDFMKSLTVYCKVSGEPKPEIWWEDDQGNHIHSEDALLEMPSVYISYATIANATTNSTIYCKCKNDGEESSMSMELFVHRDYVFKFLKYPSDTTFEYGSEGKLYCEAQTYPEGTLEWYHNDSRIEGNEHVEIVPEDNVLIIKSMSLEDTGEYKCEATNEVETGAHTAIVDISGLETPSIELAETEYILNPGDSLEVECNVEKGTPLPEVAWKKQIEDENVELPEGVYVDGKSLKISSASSDHNGVYKCHATNIQGEDSKEIIIKVQYAPKIKDGEENLMVKVGAEMKLECDVDASPKAVVHWELYQDDVIIPLDESHYTDNRNTHHFIARFQDSGNYHCNAENEVGKAEKTITVNVMGPPYIEPLAFKSLTMRTGSSIFLTCNVIQGQPIPTTRWEFISSKSSTVKVLSRKTAMKLDLSIRNITKKDEGTYQCVAENNLAFDSISVFLAVEH